jgi:protein-tyrosine kinase
MNQPTIERSVIGAVFGDEAGSSINKIAIGKLLIESGRLKREDVEKIKKLQMEKGLRFGEAAITLGLCNEDDILRALSRQFSFDWIAPTETKLASELCAVFDPFGREAEALRTIRGQLLLRWFDQGNRTLAITGVHQRSGVSHVCANLAVMFAQLGLKTLLIDANLRNPRQEGIFAVRPHGGLSDMLIGRVGMDAITRVPQIANLSLLTAGAIPPNPQELLARPSFYQLLQKAQDEFEIVLLDTPAYDVGADLESSPAAPVAHWWWPAKDMAKASVARQLQQDFASSGVSVCGARAQTSFKAHVIKGQLTSPTGKKPQGRLQGASTLACRPACKPRQYWPAARQQQSTTSKAQPT